MSSTAKMHPCTHQRCVPIHRVVGTGAAKVPVLQGPGQLTLPQQCSQAEHIVATRCQALRHGLRQTDLGRLDRLEGKISRAALVTPWPAKLYEDPT